jgi:lipopolysaccharide transport system ATP-binding protein
MSQPIISIENLGKRYRIHHERAEGYTTLRDVIARKVKRLLNPSPFTPHPSPDEDFWALKGVSFEVQPGEVIGIIGRNGAGKSTLLKILSRITESTEGRVTLRGRVASLLEVGTGFHPELTGRENIFLNGAILGMTRVEIRKKFDEIVAFAEVANFLDTPVKRYSSGMYVRLAFAVAAHLEPEVLIVDEVLAVGDAQFQKKCLGKMGEVSRAGRTVILVSHHIASITRLCQRAVWLDGGHIHESGQADVVCARYLAIGSNTASRREWNPDNRAPGNEWVRLESVEALADCKPAESIDIQSPVEIRVCYRVLRSGKVLLPNIHFYADDGTLLFISVDWYSGWRAKPKDSGRYSTVFTVPGNFFNTGRIGIRVGIGTYRPSEVHVDEPDAISFAVVETAEGETSRGDFVGHLPGAIRPLIASRTEMTA